MAKKKDVTFIITKSGQSKPTVSFYEGKTHIPASDVRVVYKDSQSGRFVTRNYTVGRDSNTGQFTTEDRARRHPKDHVVERIPKPGYGDSHIIKPIPADSPVHFHRKGSGKR